jgi:WD40 repeat protein
VGLPADDAARPLWTTSFNGAICSDPMFPPGRDRFVAVERHGTNGPKLFARSVQTGQVVAEGEREVSPEGATLSPDGRRAAALLRAWAYTYPAPGVGGHGRAIRNDGKRHFTGIAFHPSGRYLAATSNDETVKLFDAESGEPVRSFAWRVGRLRSVAFSPDGALAAAGSDTGKVVVWDVDV